MLVGMQVLVNTRRQTATYALDSLQIIDACPGYTMNASKVLN